MPVFQPPDSVLVMNLRPKTRFSGLEFAISRIGVRQYASKRKKTGDHVPPSNDDEVPGDLDESTTTLAPGERIWIFSHIEKDHVLFSLRPYIKAKHLEQIPFNGKKLKPAKIRKDYWRMLSCVEFPKGRGDVGRSVFAKMREFRRRHELEWGPQADELLAMNKRERGEALNAQKPNAIADLAVILTGAGNGNKMRITPGDVKKRGGSAKKKKKEETAPASRPAPVTAEAKPTELKSRLQQWSRSVLSSYLPWTRSREDDKLAPAAPAPEPASAPAPEEKEKEDKLAQAADLGLHPVTVHWADEWSKSYAKAWSDNVTHTTDLMQGRQYRAWSQENRRDKDGKFEEIELQDDGQEARKDTETGQAVIAQ